MSFQATPMATDRHSSHTIQQDAQKDHRSFGRGGLASGRVERSDQLQWFVAPTIRPALSLRLRYTSRRPSPGNLHAKVSCLEIGDF